MKPFRPDVTPPLVFAQKGSHKGQNGRLLVIGGSELFHAASLWALDVASKIVDLVHYSSVPENNAIVHELKKEFRNGIVVPRAEIDAYIEEDDCILIGPGMTRDPETKVISERVLTAYPKKRWVIDAGALQMIGLSSIPDGAILTPHQGEFAGLWEKAVSEHPEIGPVIRLEEQVLAFARAYRCTVLCKGEVDMVATADDQEVTTIEGGNEGMTKGGTGDVLAGLIAALACTNDAYAATVWGSYINKQAGESLYRDVGPFFNATDLAHQIPSVMKTLFF